MTTTLKCAHCAGDLARGDGYCSQCGVVVCRCPACETPLLAGVTWCPGCGAPIDRLVLPPEGSDSLWADLIERLRRATLGEFEIGRELGRGGMAAVFLAHEVALDRPVAIKVMSPGLLLGDGMVDRFRQEAITIAGLHHPSIVSVHSVRQAEGLHFFVMQYVKGRSLDEVLRQSGRLPLPVVRSILHQVGSALTYAHRRRVIHRDIKPGNILIDGDGNAVVTDFGIAKAAESPSHTLTGALLGTPAYMSPEQCRGAEVSGATDQYALGAVAYEMLTGVPPFSGSTFTVLQAQVERAPAPLREHIPDCPPEVEAAVLRMLAKDPAGRWPTAADAMAALGAEPLPDGDPLRLELTQFAASAPPPLHSLPPSLAGRPSGGTVGGIAILPPPAGIEVGDSFTLVALVRGPNGTRLPPDRVAWSSDAPDVLRLDGKGEAVALAPGSARLMASSRGVRAVLEIEVSAPRADEILIDSPEHGVRAGDEIHLEATVRDKRGRLVTRPVTWQTADPATATVTEQGTLLAQAPGLARISAVLDGVRSTISVPVLPARVAAIRIGEPPAAVAGGTFALDATPVDRWGGPLPDRTVLWSSSDVKVAVVTAGGRLHAIRAGTVVLTASCEGVSETLRVGVDAPSLPEAAPATAAPRRRVRRRRPQRLLAGSLGAGLLAGLVWLFGRPDQVTVSAALPAPDNSRIETAGASDPGAVMLQIAGQPRRSIRPGTVLRLTAEVRDADGRIIPGAGVMWAGGDSSVLQVDPASGLIRALRPGRSYVVATSGDGGRDSTPITVWLPAARAKVASLSIAPLEPLRVGESAPLRAVVLDAAGAELPESLVSWHTSDPAVAAVDSGARQVSAEAPGVARLVARVGGDSAAAELTVLPHAVADVVVHGARPLVVGDTLTLVGIPVDAVGNGLNGHAVEWSTSDPTILTVDAESGVGVARSPGWVMVTATAEGRSGGVSVLVSPPRGPAAAVRPEVTGPSAERGLLAGVEECYAALRTKNVHRVAELYRASTRADRETLKRLRRILQSRELSAVVGERMDGARMVGYRSAAMEFSLTLTWTESGGEVAREPVFRAEFARNAERWVMSSCRIVGPSNL